jgi:hypothetical protein
MIDTTNYVNNYVLCLDYSHASTAQARVLGNPVNKIDAIMLKRIITGTIDRYSVNALRGMASRLEMLPYCRMKEDRDEGDVPELHDLMCNPAN